ncbi:MAG TPA: AsnC family transcriptional regulator [Streptosporangiaceae bacterium]|nr:AsnC family transcriptional regulator [Streptosporangiaceae bacterium]
MESITVDELDRQLAQCLAADGRASFSAVAAVIGVSDQTVARRYRRLRSAGLLRVVGLRWVKSGRASHWFLRLRCLPGSGEGIAGALARRDDTAWVQLLSGDTEVLCSLREDSSGTTESLLTRLPRSERIVAVSAFSRLHIFTGGPDALGYIDVLPAERVAPLQLPPCAAPASGPGPGSGPPEPITVTELDDALFAALAVDGRTPYAELATATGWSESRVRRRVDQLRAAGMLYFKVELDMPVFGFQRATWLWLSVPPSYLAETGAALAKFPEIAYATATTGPANLAACAVCRDEESLYQFLTEKVGSLPGVERLETSPIIRTVKQASPVLLPGPGQRRGPG